MNTRLQVEHPVTELVVSGSTGEPLDLVELQLRVAAGEELPFAQDDVTARRATPSRRGSTPRTPSAGSCPRQARHWPGAGRSSRWSASSGVRVDHALESGQVVSTAYDPMLGKVIAYGRDREEARRRLVAALDDTVVLGLTTNTGFLRALAASDEFRDATIDTAWLDRTRGCRLRPADDVPRALAAWAGAPRADRRSRPVPLRRLAAWAPTRLRSGSSSTAVVVVTGRAASTACRPSSSSTAADPTDCST